MDPITLLQVTHVEQRLARAAAASHNHAVRERREPAGARFRPLVARLIGRQPAAPQVCAAC